MTNLWYNIEHRYKIAFEIVKRICEPRIESWKNYTQISVQELISYMDYEVWKEGDNKKTRKIPYIISEHIRKLRIKDELTDKEIEKIAEANKLTIRQVKEVAYGSFTETQL